MEGWSHQALRFTLSRATTATVIAFGGGGPKLRGTYSVIPQNIAPVKVKSRKPPMAIAVMLAAIDFTVTIGFQ
jgi:hypothetical protein